MLCQIRGCVMVPGGRMRSQLGINFLHGNIFRKSLKTSQKPFWPEKLTLMRKYLQIVLIQACSNHDSLGMMGQQWGWGY